MQRAITEAATGSIVILGIQPDRPETGYGYIKTAVSPAPTLSVERFVEKPDTATANSYLNEGGYYWNAGMFVLKASVWLKALEQFRPDIAQATQQAWDTRTTDAAFIRPGKAEFTAIPAESIDYAVMEPLAHASASSPSSSGLTHAHTLEQLTPPPSRGRLGGGWGQPPLKMVPLDAGWNDLGAWDAVWNVLPKDENGNAHLGDVLTTDSRNTLVHATSRLVSLVGVNNLIVIETPDAILVADKSRSQDVKHIVTALQQQKREEHTLHRKVHRPWGWYDSIDDGHRFKVKRIQVNPKASLSLQKHHHRAEHWIVVKGTAEITNGDKTILLTENQSTYIPLGEIHRLANPGTIPLEIIEVQSGSYLGEDDIVRFEDHYGR
jgi:mannose-1-phosphate guanylyltransferase / mannose-6-phosphate isomerase